MKINSLVVLLAGAFLFGLLVIHTTRDRFYKESARATNSRDPAAIRPSFDFSQMEGSLLQNASKERLVSGTRILKKRGSVGVELGHFVLRGPSGQKIFACEEYSTVKLTFEGDGTAIDGKKPMMEVESPCAISATDVNRISPIWIPATKILEEKVHEGELTFAEAEESKVSFAHVYDTWPTTWVLKGIHLSRAGLNELVVSESEVAQFKGDQHIVDFTYAQ